MGLALAPIIRAEEPPKATQKPPAEESPLFAEALARARTMSQPQPEHRTFEPLVGHFKVDLTGFSLSGKVTHLTGTGENQYVLGGRFLRSDWSVGEGDARLEISSYLGYDNAAKKYVMVALSTLGTSPLEVRGDYDAASRSFILSGKQRDETSGAGRMYRNMLKIDGSDGYELRSFVDLPGRAPFKVVQVKFARQ
jgi:hypothetical protein